MPDTGLPFEVSVIRNVPVVIVEGFIGALKVALIVVSMGTLVAMLAGFVSVIVGAVLSSAAPVVKFHGFGTLPAISALPARSLAAFEIVAVNCVVAAKLAVGVKIAVLLAAS